MFNPATVIRDAVAALNRWFERADREEEEYRRELIDPPVHDSVKNDQLKRTAAGPVLDLTTPAVTPPTNAVAGIPPPPKAPPPPKTTPAAPAATGVAGLRRRDHASPPKESVILQNVANDTVYNQRNEVVAEVNRHYEKYGKRIAAAILSKVFLPNGLQSLLTKVDLQPSGTDSADHARLVQWIDANGVETFCSRVGIRHVADEKQEPGNSALQKNVRPTVRKTGTKPSDSTHPASRLKPANIRPVELGKREPQREKADEFQDDEFSAGRFPSNS